MDTLEIKHRIMTSPFAAVTKRVSNLISKPSEWRYPELRELFAEDAALYAILPRLVGRGSHCLDVGAHIGSFAYRLSRLAPDGTLTLVEALPRKAAMLRRRFPRATVCEAAVSDSDGSATFYENIDQSGFSSLANRASRGRTVAITVDQRRLDGLMPEAQVNFLKIDVEGFEHAALTGAHDLITRCQPTILFEAGARIDSDLEGADGDAIFDLLTDVHGYRIWSVCGFHRGDPALDLRGYRRCRTYPFKAFNFVALPNPVSNGPNPSEVTS